jgi:transcriptional regulator with XRE-family HTH domain
MNATVIPVGLDPVNRHIGERLKVLRKSQGLSQDKLGAIIGVSAQQVQKYETGANRVSGAMLYGLASSLHVPVSAFFEGLPDPCAEPSPQTERPF